MRHILEVVRLVLLCALLVATLALWTMTLIALAAFFVTMIPLAAAMTLGRRALRRLYDRPL